MQRAIQVGMKNAIPSLADSFEYKIANGRVEATNSDLTWLGMSTHFSCTVHHDIFIQVRAMIDGFTMSEPSALLLDEIQRKSLLKFMIFKGCLVISLDGFIFSESAANEYVYAFFSKLFELKNIDEFVALTKLKE